MQKFFFDKICIVGVGLIGGSIGLAIKKKKIAKFVVGIVRRKQTAIQAVQKSAVDMATLDLKEGVRDADLMILCAPVSTIIRQLRQIAPYLKKSAIVTDVGSSKVEIEKAARRHLKKNVFVGSHPMTGLAHTGVEFASADLFEGAQCFVTSQNSRVNQFWRALGCRPVLLDAKKHDVWVARISYLPHLMAFSLFSGVTLGKFSKLRLKAENPSLRDLSRISKSNADLWADILLSNSETRHALGEFEKSVRDLARILRSGNVSRLKKIIQKANKLSHQICPES